jgi:transposase
MEKVKRTYDKEFKINTVKLILSNQKRISELSRELGINENTLHLWKQKYLKDAEDAFPGKGHQSPIDSELTRLKRENRVLKEERDILKKALGIFSKE